MHKISILCWNSLIIDFKVILCCVLNIKVYKKRNHLYVSLLRIDISLDRFKIENE